MTDNWLNTRAGQYLANHTIPSLIEALNRNSEALEKGNVIMDAEHPIWGSPPCDPISIEGKKIMEKVGLWKKKTGEIDRERAGSHGYRRGPATSYSEWRPTPLEVLLYRALSRLYAGDNSEDANAEAIAALSYASNDFRNVLAEHTWNPDGEGDAQRIDWNDHTSCIWNDTADHPGPDN